MRRFIKSWFVLFVLFITFPMVVSAEETKPLPETTVNTEETSLKTAVIADVTVTDVTAEEKDGVVNGTFLLRGNMGQQNNIAFGIVVMNDQKEVVDIYPIQSGLFVREGELKTIPFSYKFSEALGGRVTVWLRVEIAGGVPLGSQKVLDTLIARSPTTGLTCTVQEEKSVASTCRGTTGETLDIAYYSGSLFTKPLKEESRVLTSSDVFPLVPELLPGRYMVLARSRESREIALFPMRVAGVYGHIENVAISKGAVAGTVQMTVTFSALSPTTTTLLATLRNEQGQSCGDGTAFEQRGRVAEAVLTTTCTTGTVSLQLKDADGRVLDESVEPFSIVNITALATASESLASPTINETSLGIGAMTLLLLLATSLVVAALIIFLYRRRRLTIGLFLLFSGLGLGGFLGGSIPHAQALTQYVALYSQERMEYAWDCFVTTNLDKSSYVAGDIAVITSTAFLTDDAGAAPGSGSCLVAYKDNVPHTTAAFDSEPEGNLITIVLASHSTGVGFSSLSDSKSFSIPATLLPGAHSVERIYTTVGGSCKVNIPMGLGCVGLPIAKSDPLPFTVVGASPPTATITATGPVAYENNSLWKKALSFLIGQDRVVWASGPDATITLGQNAQITWSSMNADSCSVTDDVGTIIGSTRSDSYRLTGLSVGTHTYTITCSKSGFPDAVDSVSVVVAPPPSVASVTLTALPNPITVGGSTTLTWITTSATSCSASNGWAGAKTASGGSESVSPIVTTSYTMECWSATGTSAGPSTVMVTVNPPATPAALHICPTGATVGVSTSQQFSAWYTPIGTSFTTCSTPNGSDVASSPAITWSSSSPPNVIVNSTGLATGVASGSATVTASYSGVNDATTVSVTCTPTDSCGNHSTQAETVCTGDTFPIDNGCGTTLNCPGNRYCNYNWKEVAP